MTERPTTPFCQTPYEGPSLAAFIYAGDKAEAEGLEIMERHRDELLLDIDTKGAEEQFRAMLPLICRFYGVAKVETWPSKSHNLHVSITLNAPLGEMEALFLQACCGSDLKREFLSYRRLLNGIVCPTRLFKPKDVEVHVDY